MGWYIFSFALGFICNWAMWHQAYNDVGVVPRKLWLDTLNELEKLKHERKNCGKCK